jgi:release factor glutamine methyltransferase
MQLREVLEKLKSNLEPVYGLRESENMIKALRLDLPVIKDKKLYDDLNEEELDLMQSVQSELLAHKPLQYITGLAHFYGLQLKVNGQVLIPRPETEELVYQCLQLNNKTAPKILDIGTGSGCIPIAIKDKLATAELTAIDKSPGALNLAKENAALYNQEINFLEVDFLNKEERAKLDKYDIILSNPPYIDLSEKSRMSKSTITYEPDLALFTETDPLIFYKTIESFAQTHLNKNGFCLLEINEFRAEETQAVFKSDKWNSEIIKDLQGKPRILKITSNE